MQGAPSGLLSNRRETLEDCLPDMTLFLTERPVGAPAAARLSEDTKAVSALRRRARTCACGRVQRARTAPQRAGVDAGAPACAQLPGDAEVVRAQLRIERKARLAPPALPSSFAADVAEITGAARAQRHARSHTVMPGASVAGMPRPWWAPHAPIPGRCSRLPVALWPLGWLMACTVAWSAPLQLLLLPDQPGVQALRAPTWTLSGLLPHAAVWCLFVATARAFIPLVSLFQVPGPVRLLHAAIQPIGCAVGPAGSPGMPGTCIAWT
jgi:hypothetical protein